MISLQRFITDESGNTSSLGVTTMEITTRGALSFRDLFQRKSIWMSLNQYAPQRWILQCDRSDNHTVWCFLKQSITVFFLAVVLKFWNKET
jgi:hypothetical protein